MSLAGRYRLGDVALLAAVEVGLWEGVGNSPFRATVGVSFAPRASDADKDGFSDDDDKCPRFAKIAMASRTTTAALRWTTTGTASRRSRRVPEPPGVDGAAC
ncbi:MAG: hypothetical protein IPM79_19505 [Polyangiaceae bacterium]|nr:hypothetical protein [Polyangiaceae bacterium]